MIKKEDYFTSSNMRTQIHYVTWQPEGDIVAIVQIVHGMFCLISCKQGHHGCWS